MHDGLSRQDGGEWTTTGPVWLQPPTDAGFVELVIAEARAALLLRLSGDGRAPE